MFRRKDLIKRHLRQRFHVTLKDSAEAFEGVLTGSSDFSFEFSDVTFEGMAAASPLYIDRNNISYIQAALPQQVAAVITSAIS